MTENQIFSERFESKSEHTEPAIFEFLDLKLDEELTFEKVNIVSESETETAVKARKLETPLGTDSTSLVDTNIITMEGYTHAKSYLQELNPKNITNSKSIRLKRIALTLGEIGTLLGESKGS